MVGMGAVLYAVFTDAGFPLTQGILPLNFYDAKVPIPVTHRLAVIIRKNKAPPFSMRFLPMRVSP